MLRWGAIPNECCCIHIPNMADKLCAARPHVLAPSRQLLEKESHIMLYHRLLPLYRHVNAPAKESAFVYALLSTLLVHPDSINPWPGLP